MAQSPRTFGHQNWDGAFEALESRQLLDGGSGQFTPIEGHLVTEHMPWQGVNAEVLKDSWIVTFAARQTDAQALARTSALLGRLGVHPVGMAPIQGGNGRWVTVSVNGHAGLDEASIRGAVAASPGVMALEPNFISRTTLVPNDPRFPEQYPLENTGQTISGVVGTPMADLHATQAWNVTTGSRSVIVAVLDTGIDYNHPDLAANIWTNPGEIAGNGLDDDANGFIDDVHGYDFAGDMGTPDADPMDPPMQGHGTEVAGTIGAVGNNGRGVSGINWAVTIIACKIFPSTGGAPQNAIIGALNYVAMLKTRFNVNITATNNSYGLEGSTDPTTYNIAEQQAIQETTDAGVLFVAASGNDALNNDDRPHYPAAFPNPDIIAVAATDNQDRLATFSDYGVISTDVGAPGVQTLTTQRGGGYTFVDGTSFASPYTCGVIALLKSASPFATPAQLKAALYAGVDHIDALASKTVTGGRVNAYRSLQIVGFPGPLVTEVFPGNVSAPVNIVQIAFNKPINPASFSPAGIELRRANGDGDFNGNDVYYTLTTPDVTFSPDNRTIRVIIPSGNLPVDLYRLTLRNGFFRDFSGNFLNGTTVTGNDESRTFQIVPASGPFEPNDSSQQATPVILDSSGNAVFNGAVIGDGNDPTLDVDMYRLTLAGPGLLTARVDAKSLANPSTLDAFLRLFDSSGREISRNDNYNGLDPRVQFFLPSGGAYYVGVSGYGNAAYSPNGVASGALGQSTGTYNLSLNAAVVASEDAAYASSSTPAALPATGTINNSIFIPDVRNVQRVSVAVRINHAFIGDLQVRLIAPNGVSVPLILNRGGDGDNLGNAAIRTVFDDSAPGAIAAGSAPFAGRFRPEGMLSDIVNAANKSAAGFWTLQVTDTAPLNSGTLVGWSLDLTLENSASGAFEFNDSLATAVDLGITGAGSRTIDAASGLSIGDGAYGLRDVDIFRVVVDAGTTLAGTIAVPGSNRNGSFNALDATVRLLDQQGNQLLVNNRTGSSGATFSFPVRFSGTYYIAVSGGSNTDFDPNRPGFAASGAASTPSPAGGSYTLQASVVGGLSDGAILLTGTTLTVGLNADGSFGVATGPAPAGIARSGADFLLAGPTESFYGAIFNGFIFRNAGPNSDSILPISTTNASDGANRRAVAEGLFRALTAQNDQGGGLLVRRSVAFGVNDGFIAIDVTLTNTTFSSMDGVGWVEGFNPQQSLALGSNFGRTVNNVDNATGRLVTSTFVSPDFPGGLTIGIGAPVPRAGLAVTAGVRPLGSVRDPFQVIGAAGNDPDTSPADAGAESDSDIAVAYNLGALGAGQSRTFRYFIFTGATLAEVQGLFAAAETNTGSGHLVADPASSAVPAAALPYALYYPEGYANSRISEFVPIVNPNPAPARVVITARYESGVRDQVLFDEVVAGNTRSGITISTPALYAANTLLVRKDTPYALEIRSSLPVGAELSHYDFNISTGQAFNSRTSDVWTFGEGFKGSGVNDFLVFYNPNPAGSKVTLQIFPESGNRVLTLIQEVGAFRRGGWSLAETPGLPDGPFGMKITSELPVSAALSHYDTNLHGGFGVLGLPRAGATSGVTPEGQFGVNSGTEFVTVLNSGTADSTVTFTFFFENGSAYRNTIAVPAQRRSGFALSALPNFPRGQRYSVGYEANNPVSVILPSYAFGSAVGAGLTDEARSLWLFADGFRPASGAGVTEYLRLFNPNLDEVTIEITVDFAPNEAAGDAGGSETFRRVLTPRAANEFNIHDFVSGARAGRDTFYSLVIKSPRPIVAYAGHYDAFLNGAFGTLGTPLGTVGAAI